MQRFCGLCGATAQNRAGEQSLGEAMDLICPSSVGGGKREEGVGGFAVEWRADGPGALLARMILREADENKDRRMSADELLKGAMKAFDAADEDDDDALSEEELLVEVSELMNPREREK